MRNHLIIPLCPQQRAENRSKNFSWKPREASFSSPICSQKRRRAAEMRAVVISDPSGRACNNSGSLRTVLLRTVLEKGRSGAFAGGLVDGDPSFLEVGHWLRNISLRVSPSTRWRPSGSGLSGIAASRSVCHRRVGSISTIQVSSSKPVPWMRVSTYSGGRR